MPEGITLALLMLTKLKNQTNKWMTNEVKNKMPTKINL